MTQEYSDMANSIVMWIACAPGVLIVLFQSFLFFKKSKADAIKIGLTQKQVTSAVRSAAVTSIGPCFVMLTAMLTLILYVGAPLAWLRVDFIGSVSYELQGADFAAKGMGIELGSAAMDANYLATAAIVMAGGCIGWVIFAALFADKMDKVNHLMSGGNAALVPILGTGALIGVFSSLTTDRVYPFRNQAFAVIISGLIMFIIQKYNKKANKQWVKEWGLTICMIVGMVGATILEGLNVLPK
ncbi:DUF5058 family protein [Anaeropeptidivorans aminofermentans]|jgi:hypothetical protein|uniref:DUF5058 family protein n=1 Tax=Anaeropeptidivorans aminofermentans TaxID=2934315 RepID=UPI000ED8D1F4|nr:DUF5058 family protein [Anaeropeptidivorans aminofermentans]HAQ39881.1 DUF5058 domain-containing protein [Clostridiales bacterium]